MANDFVRAYEEARKRSLGARIIRDFFGLRERPQVEGFTKLSTTIRGNALDRVVTKLEIKEIREILRKLKTIKEIRENLEN